MAAFSLLTFLSDFGRHGAYVAACEAVILSVYPEVRVLHTNHEVRPGDTRTGGLILERVAPLGPPAVHLAVVDPGVGTERIPLTLRTSRGDFLVGPDNGLLTGAAAALGGITRAWALTAGEVRREAALPAEQVSATFHGRDLFAPAAALLARGIPAHSLGRETRAEDLVYPAPPRCAEDSGHLQAEVVEVDRFGNVSVAAGVEHGPLRGSAVEVRVEGSSRPPRAAHRVHTFADLASGEMGLLEDSWGMAALVLRQASAAEYLGVETGDVISFSALDVQSSRQDSLPK